MPEIAVQSGGPAQTLNLVLPSESIKPVVHLLIVLLAALVITIPMSVWAIVMTEVQIERVNDLDRDARLQAYWSERAEIAAEKQGIKLPPLPRHK